jgi:hypothetical protein
MPYSLETEFSPRKQVLGASQPASSALEPRTEPPPAKTGAQSIPVQHFI